MKNLPFVIAVLLTTAANAQRIATELSDTSNSTTTPLADGATYTGNGSLYMNPDVMTSTEADADGTIYYDFSDDNTNWETHPANGFKLTAGVHEFHTAVCGFRYFRVRIVDDADGVTQSYLRQYTYRGAFRHQTLPLDENIEQDADAMIVRAMPFDIDLAYGKIGGHAEGEQAGHVENVDAADGPKDVWWYANNSLSGQDTIILPSQTDGAQSLFMCSDNSADVAIDIEVTYIDDGGVQVTDTFTLDGADGQNVVDLSIQTYGINFARRIGRTPIAGNVFLFATGAATGGVPDDPSTVYAYVSSEHQQTQQAIYTVPINKTMRIKQLFLFISRDSGALGSAELHIRVREFGGAWRVVRDEHITTSTFYSKYLGGIIIPARSNVVVRLHDVSDNGTHANAEFLYDLIDD